MYNKIKLFIFLIVVFLNLSVFVYAADENLDAEANVNTEEQEGESLKDGKTAVIVKEANLVKIAALQYVFIETQGSLEDTFQSEIDIVSSYILRYGIPDRKIGILFLDLDAPYNGGRYNILLEKGIPNKIDKQFLYDQYGESYFKVVRKVLVGSLIMPNDSISASDNIKVYNIKPSKATIRQTYFVGLSKNVYSVDQRSLDRGTMIDYMNSNLKANYKSLGMMELYDSQTDSYLFIDFPGDKDLFMKDNDISPIGIVKKSNLETKEDLSK